MRRWREVRGWSQADLARKAGMPVAKLCKVELGRQDMSRADYEALAKAAAECTFLAVVCLARLKIIAGLSRTEYDPVFRSPPKEFQRWVNDTPAARPDDPDIVMFGTREHRQGRNIVDRRELQRELRSNPNPHRNLFVTKEQPNNQREIGHLLSFSDKNTNKVELYGLTLELSRRFKEEIIIANMTIRNRRFTGHTGQSKIIVRNCWVENLTLQNGIINMDIIDSHIGHLELLHGGWNNLTVEDSSLASVRFGTRTVQLVVGNAKITNLVTPRGNSWYDKRTEEADQWAQAKQDLAHLGNEWAAGIFHATEMSIRSRENTSRLVRQFGVFYEDACDYGNSVARPVLWVLFWFFLSWLSYFAY